MSEFQLSSSREIYLERLSDIPMEKVVDYSLEWDINPSRPDSWRIIITTTKHTTPFRLPIDTPTEFLAAAHMLSRSGVMYDLDKGVLVVLQRPAGT